MTFIFGAFSPTPARAANRRAVDAIANSTDAAFVSIVEIDEHFIVGWTGASLEREVLARSASLHLLMDACLYNRRDLEVSLQPSQHTLAEITDVELVCELVTQGPGIFPDALNGDFAGALYDKASKRFSLFRDHFGVRPLCYLLDGASVYFASKAKSLIATPHANTNFRLNSLAAYLLNGAAFEDHTFYEAVRAVSPGTILKRCGASLKPQRYWRPENTRIARGIPDAALLENFQDQLIRAVRSRIPAQGVIGAMVSGGLDSSTIAAIACAGNRDRQVHAFSVALPEGYSGPATDERQYVDALARHCPNLSVHYVVNVTRDPLASLIGRTSFQGGPPLETTGDSDEDLERAAQAEDVDVMLSGLGGDLLISGYADSYLAESLANGKIGRVLGEFRRRTSSGESAVQTVVQGVIKPFVPWSILRLRRRMMAQDYTRNHALRADFLRKGDFESECIESGWEAQTRSYRSVRDEEIAMIRLNAQLGGWFSDDLSSQNSKISYRHPLFDKSLVESCLSMPSNIKVTSDCNRMLIRATARDFAPNQIANRLDKGEVFLRYNEMLRPHIARMHSEFERFRKNEIWNSIVDQEKIEEGFCALDSDAREDVLVVSLKLWRPMALGLLLCPRT